MVHLLSNQVSESYLFSNQFFVFQIEFRICIVEKLIKANIISQAQEMVF